MAIKSFAEQKAEFEKRIKVSQATNRQSKIAKQSQFASKNASNSNTNSNHASAPERQRSLTTGRGNER